MEICENWLICKTTGVTVILEPYVTFLAPKSHPMNFSQSSNLNVKFKIKHMV